MILRNFLRSVKRYVCTRGYARPVHAFLEVLPHIENSLPEGEYVVNVSFDLEHAYSTSFWTSEFGTALEYGKRSYENFVPISTFLKSECVPHNVQVVGMLLEKELPHLSYMGGAQREFRERHMELCVLDPRHAELLTDTHVDLGLHGYSHRLFSDITEQEAREELVRAQTAWGSYFGSRVPKPHFLSFPRNRVCHEDLLPEYGIDSWRTHRHRLERKGEIPLGLWFAPGILGVHDLRKVLRRIRGTKKSFLLHVWSHYTEMDGEVFKEHIDVMRDEGWKFKNVRQIMNEYE